MSPQQQLNIYRLLYLLSLLFILSPNTMGQFLNHRQGQLIVQLKPGFGWESNQIKSFTSRSASALQKVRPIKKLETAWNMWLVSFDFSIIKESSLITELKNLPEVLNVQKNHLLKSRIKPNDPYFDSQWYHFNNQNPLADFDSDKAWDLTTGGVTDNGDTIVICIIDDGIDVNHEDLKANLWHNHGEIAGNGLDDDGNGYVDDFQGWNTYKGNDTFDIGKHGTPVTGLAAASGNNGLGISGICWNVKIMFVEGGGDEANALESYAYPLLQRRLYNESAGKKGAFVVATNSSWGSDRGLPEDAPLWCAIYDSLGAEGIVSIASTANLNIDVDVEGDLPTACESEFLIAVTNMNMDNLKDLSAAYGKKSIDLGAYGESVFSTFVGNAYRTFSGTSAASPQVSGAVALIYSLPCSNLSYLSRTNPPEAAREVKRILLNSVRPNNDLINTTVSGGVLNLYQSLQMASPMSLVQVTDHSLLFQWDPIIIFPVYIRYRIIKQINWIDTTIYSGQQLRLTGLDACTEYELQYKNICSRNTDNYSQSRIYKTSGCCDAPSEFKILKNSGNEMQFSYKYPDTGQLVVLLRLTGSTSWDTFVMKTSQSEFTLYNLDPCSQYEFFSYSYCNNHPTPLSRRFVFNTNGCGECSSLDYCKRFKPSSDLEWLEAIQINNDRFTSGNNLGYGNYVGSNQSWTFEKNKSYPVTFQAGYLDDTSEVVVAAWIDYNQNGVFDTSENFATPTEKFIATKSYTLKIPSNAKSGLTRMRICLKFAEISESTPLPCFQSIEFGECEDYCVLITGSLCEEIEFVQINSIEPDRATLFVSDPSSNSFSYGYRKLYNSDWTLGVASSKTIQLNNLDSCSRYELKIQSVCNENKSEPSYFKFNTPGTGCIISTHETDAEKFFISPNPFSNQIIIHNPDNKYIASMNIYSIDGKIVLDQKLQSNQSVFQFSPDTKPGYYLMQLILKDGGSKIFKLVCQ